MTSLERVLGAVRGVRQERPPFTLTLSMYGARLTGCPLKEYYRSPSRYADGQMAVLETFSPDIIFGPFALPLEAEAFGSELVFFDNNPPNVRKPAFRSPEASDQLAIPVTAHHAGLSYIKESIRLLAERLQGRTTLCAILTAPTDLPAILFGIEGWLEILLFDEERASMIMEVMHRYFVDFVNELFALGAHFVALPAVLTNPQLLQPSIIRKRIIPALERSFSEVKGPLVFHHGGMPVAKILRDFVHLPNIAGFAIDQRDSFADAREAIGPDRVLLGNLHGPTLSALNPESARARVAAILEDRKADDRFVFATAAADVPWNTPAETIHAVVDTIRSYRRST